MKRIPLIMICLLSSLDLSAENNKPFGLYNKHIQAPKGFLGQRIDSALLHKTHTHKDSNKCPINCTNDVQFDRKEIISDLIKKPPLYQQCNTQNINKNSSDVEQIILAQIN